jgi:hypothetical protein
VDEGYCGAAGAGYFTAGAGATGIGVPGYFWAAADAIPNRLITQTKAIHLGIHSSRRLRKHLAAENNFGARVLVQKAAFHASSR